MTNMLKPKENQTRSQWIWILLFRLIGIVLFLIGFFKPAKSLILDNVDTANFSNTNWVFIGAGFLCAWGGKYFGEIANSLGKFISSKLSKL